MLRICSNIGGRVAGSGEPLGQAVRRDLYVHEVRALSVGTTATLGTTGAKLKGVGTYVFVVCLWGRGVTGTMGGIDGGARGSVSP